MRLAIPAPLLNSLGLRVLLAYLAGVVLSIALIALGMVVALRDESLFAARVAEQAEIMVKRVDFDQAGVPVRVRANERGLNWVYSSLKDEMAYRVFDAAGKVVLYSPAGASFWADAAADTNRMQQGKFVFQYRDATMLAAAEPVQHEGRTWYLQFAASTRLATLFHVHYALPLVGRGIGLFSSVLLIIFCVCAYITLRRTFRPLRDISAAAAAISPRSMDARLPLQGVPTEVVPLVDSFNRVLERLEHGYKVQQEFLATAAHELKTPLALIRAQVELSAPSADRDALLQDVEHMTRQVQQLLLLAEASETHNYRIEPVNVMAVARDAAAYLQRMAQAAAVRIELSCSGAEPQWQADRSALFTLLKNLLENAIQHAPHSSVVQIEASAVSVTVRDFGAGVEAEQLPRLFERFWRAAHRRDQGAGLGLAICREVAAAHGWMLQARRAEPGLLFIVTAAQVELPTSPRT